MSLSASLSPTAFRVPPFRQSRLFRGGHAQTIAGAYLPGPLYRHRARAREVSLPDGDRVVLHDDAPASWSPGGAVALLLHGLAGDHRSGYMVRIAAKLNAIGVRTFRMDHRGCGAGRGLATHPYHAGRSEDARAAAHSIAELCPQSPICVVGFSLSGNVVLKLLGEHPERLPPQIAGGAAVNPSLDLAACCGSLVDRWQRMYDRHFVGLLCKQIEWNRRLRPDVAASPQGRRSLWEFDDAYTAPVCGFGTAENYYAINSSARHVANIRVPTLILTAADDPLVPAECFSSLAPPANVRLHVAEGGGHLGYIGRSGVDPDRRWMDWRIVDWVASLR